VELTQRDTQTHIAILRFVRNAQAGGGTEDGTYAKASLEERKQRVTIYADELCADRQKQQVELPFQGA
jgi:hypothetical protein